MPFVELLLTSLAQARPLVFITDGSEVGRGCLAMVISLVYGHRALPIAWVVVDGTKGHLPGETRWIIYLGTLASQPHWRRLVHRADRCDLSFFQLGMRLLAFWLEDDAPLRVAFLPQPSGAQTFVLNSVR